MKTPYTVLLSFGTAHFDKMRKAQADTLRGAFRAAMELLHGVLYSETQLDKEVTASIWLGSRLVDVYRIEGSQIVRVAI